MGNVVYVNAIFKAAYADFKNQYISKALAGHVRCRGRPHLAQGTHLSLPMMVIFRCPSLSIVGKPIP